MPYEFFDHQADIGIVGIGKTINESFQEAAKAMFEIMCDLKEVKPAKSISIKVDASDASGLLVEWLNALLAQKDIKEMLFSKFEVKIKDNKLQGKAFGEKLNKKHHLKVEVKAATFSQLKVFKSGTKYKAQCVVDV